jgi:hypothetical protein
MKFWTSIVLGSSHWIRVDWEEDYISSKTGRESLIMGRLNKWSSKILKKRLRLNGNFLELIFKLKIKSFDQTSLALYIIET